MYCKVMSAVLKGLKTEFVCVETDIQNGLPMLHMVGCLASEVKESGERIKAAAKNMGMGIPAKKIIVNLAPAWVRKSGAAFDLPIGVSILGALMEIPKENLENVLILGELGLDGSVRPMRGLLPMVLHAKTQGVKTCVIPHGNLKEGKMAEGMRLIGVSSLKETIEFLKEGRVPRHRTARKKEKKEKCIPDFSDIKGQRTLKRAAEVAVCGGHNMLMVGPPGAGKTMIAKRVAGILPKMGEQEKLEIMKIYSVLGLLDEMEGEEQRPFREVHHTITKAALIGGGIVPKPGELSLANGGILFLDELAEFQRGVLEVLRQPLEERQIRLVRNSGNYVFPADCIVVAATNACPCGNFPDLSACTCTPSQRRNYFGRISQPFLSRIDICVEAPKIQFKDISADGQEETSALIRKRIEKAREIQEKRFGNKSMVNAKMGIKEIERFCIMDGEAKDCLKEAYTALGLTPRLYHKILRVARTIADLKGDEKIKRIQIREALGYRVMEQRNWRE